MGIDSWCHLIPEKYIGALELEINIHFSLLKLALSVLKLFQTWCATAVHVNVCKSCTACPSALHPTLLGAGRRANHCTGYLYLLRSGLRLRPSLAVAGQSVPSNFHFLPNRTDCTRTHVAAAAAGGSHQHLVFFPTAAVAAKVYRAPSAPRPRAPRMLGAARPFTFSAPPTLHATFINSRKQGSVTKAIHY